MPATSDAPQDQHQQASAVTSNTPKWIPNKDERDDLNAIDAAIAQMRKVTKADPYVLTIPQDVEPRYHHQSHQHAEAFMDHAPFDRSEHEGIQYQTFHFHEHGKNMFVLRNSQPIERTSPTGANAQGRPGTGANTPSGVIKKKMSFNDYKSKRNGVAATPDSGATKTSDAQAKQAAVKGPIERVKAETEDILAAVAEPEETMPPAKLVTKQQNDLKRKREEQSKDQTEKKGPEKSKETNNTQPSQSEATADRIEPPAKKAKVAAEEPAKESSGAVKKDSQNSDKTMEKAASQETGMPPRLSPGMPPRLSPGLPDKLTPLHKSQDLQSGDGTDVGKTALPPRLSPTLPDNIAKTLEARTSLKTSPRPAHSSAPISASKDKDGKLTPLKKPDAITKHKSPIPRNGFRANSSSPAVRSDAEGGKAVAAAPRAKSPVRPSTHGAAIAKAPEGPKPHSQAKEGLIVKIKIKKAKRQDVQRMLNTRPTPKVFPEEPAEVADQPKPTAKTAERRNGEHKDTAPVKGVAQKVGPSKKKDKQPSKQDEVPPKAEKRPAPEEDDIGSPVAKRKKTEASEARKAPSTPAPRDIDSPLAQKSAVQATPGSRKDLLSAAMKREQSQDSSAAHSTPPAVSSTPRVNGASSAQPNGVAKAPSSQPSSKTPKEQAWLTERTRLESLGRELKHAASAHLAANGHKPDSKDQKLAAMKCVESFICYLLAFTSADEASLAADPQQIPAHRIWRSLHGFYGFVKRATEPFAHLSGLVSSLGMVFNQRMLEIATQYPNEGPGRDTLLEVQKQMHFAASEADLKLDVDVLEEHFPKAWKGRTKALPKEKALEPAKWEGQYKLPIQVATSPVRAARAGYAILQEWIEKEKIDYHLKLKL